MLTNELNWSELKAEVSFQKTDWVAQIRTDENTLAWEPVFLRESDGTCFIKRYGQYVEPAEVPGFVKYERVKPLKAKMWYDTSRNELVGS